MKRLRQAGCFYVTTLFSAFAAVACPAQSEVEQPSRSELKNASRRARASYEGFGNRPVRPVPSLAEVDEERLPAPQRKSLAIASNASFVTPGEINARDGELRATLVVTKAFNSIGQDRVFLRSYNGNLVGPTYRAKPGDVLRITVRNDLAPEPTFTGDMNSLHGFNRTNLHTHGLHVSPSGVSDNVLLTIAPGATQEYQIHIPDDHDPGTFWYHAHVHGATAAQVSSGMAGMLIIEGGLDNVQEIRNARERIFVLQQISYFNEGLQYGVIEEQYADKIFGPNRWDTLARYTTVNGVQIPVFQMQPGEVERWRIVHAGVREEVLLKVVPSNTTDESESVPMHEIARDGLALGEIIEQESIELWPGYRSDVLFKAPDQAGEYLIIDERLDAEQTLDGNPSPRKYIAKIVVSGDAEPMELPKSADLTRFRKPTLMNLPESDVGTQSAKYAILSGPRFTIDDQEFSHSDPRLLDLGTVDQWTLTAQQAHPFHIHVNPFEVFSIKNNATGEELVPKPYWRDTIVLRGDYTVKMRTKYERFTGVFVQHCHILDHEDQGMMQLVEVVDPEDAPLIAAQPNQTVSHQDLGATPALLRTPYDAADWELPNSQGDPFRLSQCDAQAVVLILFQGHGCLHCAEQVALFSEQVERLRAFDAQVIGVSTDSVDQLRTALETARCDFLLLADPQRNTFQAYGCLAAGKPLHGTFVLDATRQVRWQSVSHEPLMSVDTVESVLDQIRSETIR